MNTTWSSRSINPELVKGLVDLASEERHNWDSWGNGFEWVTLMNAGQLPAAAALLGLAFIVCTLVITGLPPLSGFVGKFAMLSALLNPLGLTASAGTQPGAPGWTLFVLMIATGLLALIALTRVGIRHFWSTHVGVAPQLRVLEGLPIAVLLASVTCARVLIGGAKELVMSRVGTKLSLSVQAAAMMRTLSLPAPFYRAYASGDLSARLSSIETLASMLQNIVLTTGLTSVFSLAYVAQIAAYAPGLALPALGVILASAAVSVASVLVQVSVTKRKLEHSARRKGWEYALFTGIQKILSNKRTNIIFRLYRFFRQFG